ncbi:ABC transporter permease [bacterium (Candidatus Blackallbacteria) CG17_big_fil_post_rev_8_21_14_2_50_48_46]|uniref:ABC transporter permease n=1 Tax=bacterium (Candidatus Blackallbacteria) CG17_big_fil_post_rev_8_21_14_2_50_48_46 TaxID=2014261 RepID=A0A2M7G0W1_9BACT|nr:MAG: ABC transporter permease [bacterium (Candidatus Blackallbacteria) CG18_big_fil_WC_8_21_14_2_50_49_26]PIW15344.1 MAG: ABC transporter permease [bacterium (Candidatus Blackallbacteria) CG17_big_fil_post_rev_8_21_14_2_50_48_46]PIW49795.1 MAG: ABC transporter permease [bacterium (Candidatus Blackallbacteria) CG13_big_fil_rev_8_21_14_2_50_49_14]
MAYNTPMNALSKFTKTLTGAFRFSLPALKLVWQTAPLLAVMYGLCTLLAGLVPAGIAYTGKLLIDSVLAAAQQGSEAARQQALFFVALEGGLVITQFGLQKGIQICQSLLRALLGHKVNVLILEKALLMSLPQFEDSEFYDRLTRARREASSRPLGLINRLFGLVQNTISLITYCGLLLAFSPWAVLLLALAAIPAFIAETKFSGDAFRLFSWRAPESREQTYLEMMIAREDYAKEVQLYQLGPLFLQRYKDIFQKIFGEDRALTWKRNIWGFFLGGLSTLALYGAYAWTVLETIAAHLSLGEMTMYLLVFKQGQAAFASSLNAIGGMFEDNLYLSTLYEFLDQPTPGYTGKAQAGPLPGDGIRFEQVSFRYPGADKLALEAIDLHLKPGRKLALVGENGSGKTTLIKLLTRLYEPEGGRILLDGLELKDWDIQALRDRVGVIFQDFVRYQMELGENIGAGDLQDYYNEARWEEAGEKGMVTSFLDELPERYHTQLGRWFKNGRELSGGQWQRIALARAFMRHRADILVLDEPTSAMDAEAEALIFERFREITQNQMAIVISHRFSTVRMADDIVVLDKGHIIERGSHSELMQHDGIYARLFALQAQGYL